MKLPLLLTSTTTDDTLTSTVINKTCLLCDWKYCYRRNLCREDLEVGTTDGRPSHVTCFSLLFFSFSRPLEVYHIWTNCVLYNRTQKILEYIHWVAWGTGTPKDRDEVNKNLWKPRFCSKKGVDKKVGMGLGLTWGFDWEDKPNRSPSLLCLSKPNRYRG
jgi:hypothetical protein